MWRWNNILTSLNLSANRYFDVQVLNGCLSLLSNLLHFERLHYKWQVHQKGQATSKTEETKEDESLKKSKSKGKKSQAEQEKELIKTIKSSDTSELSRYPTSSSPTDTPTKTQLKKMIPNAIFHLRIEKLQTHFLTILQLLCENEKEFLRLQHVSVYKYYVGMIEQIYTESNELKRTLSYEKLFLLINLLNTIWNKYTIKQPGLWKSYAFDHPETLKMLLKISFKLEEQGAIPCLCLLATAFEIKSPTVLEIVVSTGKSHAQGTDSLHDINLADTLNYHKNSKSKRNHRKDRSRSNRKDEKEEVKEEKTAEKPPIQDVDMEDEETREKVHQLVNMFSRPLKSVIEIFVVGKTSKMLRNAATHFIKGLWECADHSSKDKISGGNTADMLFNVMVSMQSSSASLISYILKQKASSEKDDMSVESAQSNLKIANVFEFVKKALNRSNDLIFSHQNLELYSTLYKFVGNSKPNLSMHGVLGVPSSSNRAAQNTFIFEREPCIKCFDSQSEDFSLQLINDIKSDMKSNEQSQVYKLSTPMCIKDVILNAYDLKGSKRVNEVSIYTNNSQNAELSAIKRDKSVWTFITTMKVSEEKGEKRCKFPVPITACNLMFEFHVVNSNRTTTTSGLQRNNPYSDPYGGGYDYDAFNKYNSYLGRSQGYQTFSVNNKEVLTCPRCHTIVEDAHGVCATCRENAFQCKFCHNINYENLEAFLCNECGLSGYGKYDFSIVAKPDFVVEKIKNEKMREDAENISIVTHSKYQKVMERRESLINKLKLFNKTEGLTTINDIQNSFNEASILYQAMMKSYENSKNLRKELLEYEDAKRGEDKNSYQDDGTKGDIFSEDVHMETGQNVKEHETEGTSGCFGCAFSALETLLNFIKDTASIKELNSLYLEEDFISKLYSENLTMFSSTQRHITRSALCKIVSKDTDACLKLLRMIETSVLESPKTSILHNSKDRDDSVPYQMLLMELMKKLHHKYEKNNKNKKDLQISESYAEALKVLMKILLSSIDYGQKSAPVASGLIANCLQKIYELVESEAPGEKLKKVPSSASPKKMAKHTSSTRNFKGTPIESIIKIGQLSKSESREFDHLEVIVKCLLMRTSHECRSLASKILQSLVEISDNNYYKIIDLLENYMDESMKNEEISEQFFELLSELLDKDKITEIVKKNQENEDLYTSLLSKLFEQVTYKCEMLGYVQKKKERLGAEGLYMELNQGKSLGGIINIISNMIQVDFIKKEFKSGTYTYATIKSFLNIKKLFLLKNKTLIDCENKINKMFKEMNADSDEEKEKFILACLKLTEECDKQEITFLYENIKNIIDPVKPIPNYQMNLNKNPNHEIYLRGRMSKNPYCIKDLGNSMRSVLEKICLEHEMTHATDLIEMLVANNIIVPDLPAHLVYEKVWYPYVYKQRNPDEYEVPPIDTVDSSYKIPMEVIYRLTGVDGEASENRVENLQDDDELAKDPEKKYALAKTLSHKLDKSDKTGLSIMLNDFKKVESIKRDSYLLTNVLQMLTIALKLKDNIKEVIQINGADILVDKLFTFLSEDINEEQQQLLNQVIASLEAIVVEGSKLALEEDMEVDTEKKEDSTSTLKNVSILLEKIINACETMADACRGIQNTSDQIIAISRILPYLTNNNKEAEQKIADLIAPNISNLEMLSEDNQKNYRWEEKFRVEFYCERFLNFLESAQNSVKQTFTKNGIAEELCKYLGRTLTDQLIDNEEKLLRQEKPLSLALKSLTFYLKSNALSQEVIYNCNKDNQVLEQIFKLSKTRLKERNLSILAEGVIESMTFESEMNDKTAHEFVKDLVNQKDLEKKKRAERKKKAMLAKMKKPGTLIKKKFKLEEVKDEKGITCIICQEGYQENDKDLLGIYVFVKKITMTPDKVTQHSDELGYTTVTHFNSIHFKCHRNAYDADCNRKKPLREWEGAQIRNSHTKCNALFPIKGGSITESSYGQYVNEYLSNLAYNVFQVSSNKVRVMYYDLKNLIKKLAFEESFSKDSLGGGAEHNINFIPFMMHMTLMIMKDNGELLSNKQQENVDKFLTEALTKIEEMKKFQHESEVEEQKIAEEIEEEVKFMGEKEDVDEEDFDSLAKSVNEKLETWMYWALVS